MSGPLVEAALRALRPGGGTDPAAMRRFETALAVESESQDFAASIRQLMVFAVYVGERLGDRPTALALLERAARWAPKLEEKAAEAREREHERAERLRREAGRPMIRVAPLHGSAPPTGATPLKALLDRRIVR